MTNKFRYFVANWKMFGNYRAFNIIHRIHLFLSKFKKRGKIKKVIVCVPNVFINSFSKKLKSKFISIGAQNCSMHKNNGPYTGSTSSTMLKRAGAKYIIIGHSENRLEGETNKIIKKKIESALDNKMIVIFCIGEKFNEKIKGKTFLILKKQINESVDKKNNFKNIIIAYEPVWAIGSGKIPNENDLKKIFRNIKFFIKKNFKVKKDPIILYGGSVNQKNISNFSKIQDIDGFLIGGASQSSKKFIDIIKNYYK